LESEKNDLNNSLENHESSKRNNNYYDPNKHQNDLERSKYIDKRTKELEDIIKNMSKDPPKDYGEFWKN